MAGEVQPLKVAGGGGYVFEDKVAAYFLSFMLAQKAPFGDEFGHSGLIARVGFQTKAAGWLLDDLLLILEDDTKTRECAISVKSKSQFTGKSAPKDFVDSIWRQYLHLGTDKFDPSRDLLALVTPPHSNRVSVAIHGLLEKARRQDPAQLPANLNKDGYTSEEERNLFRSFRCPEGLVGERGTDDVEVARLLKSLVVRECDFGRDLSDLRRLCLDNCRDAFPKSCSQEDDAQALWNALLALAQEVRNAGGSVDITDLKKRLERTRPWQWARLGATQTSPRIGQERRTSLEVLMRYEEKTTTFEPDGSVLKEPVPTQEAIDHLEQGLKSVLHNDRSLLGRLPHLAGQDVLREAIQRLMIPADVVLELATGSDLDEKMIEWIGRQLLKDKVLRDKLAQDVIRSWAKAQQKRATPQED